MSISNKYNIPLETVRQMVKDGTISCSVARYDEVFDAYKKYKTEHPDKSNSQIFYELSEQMTNITYESVKKIVYIMGKKS